MQDSVIKTNKINIKPIKDQTSIALHPKINSTILNINPIAKNRITIASSPCSASSNKPTKKQAYLNQQFHSCPPKADICFTTASY